MGGDSSKEEYLPDPDELRKELKKNKQPINILLVGNHSVGKSALANTVYRVLTGERHHTLTETRSPDAQGSDPTTSYYRKHDMRFGEIRFFDIPGFDYSVAAHRRFLKKVLPGIKSPLQVPLDAPDTINPTPFPENKITFVIFVVDSVVQTNPNGASLKDYKKTFNLIVANSGVNPFLVFTKRDVCGKGQEERLFRAFKWFSDDNKFYLTNYHTKGPRFIEHTEDTVIRLLDAIKFKLEAHQASCD